MSSQNEYIVVNYAYSFRNRNNYQYNELYEATKKVIFM
jgi:hypothetical protein